MEFVSHVNKSCISYITALGPLFVNRERDLKPCRNFLLVHRACISRRESSAIMGIARIISVSRAAGGTSNSATAASPTCSHGSRRAESGAKRRAAVITIDALRHGNTVKQGSNGNEHGISTPFSTPFGQISAPTVWGGRGPPCSDY
jgi:hypothetical protein